MPDTLKQVVEELNQRKGEWPQIAQEAGVSYSWLCKLAQGVIQNPRYLHLQKLARVLLSPEAA